VVTTMESAGLSMESAGLSLESAGLSLESAGPRVPSAARKLEPTGLTGGLRVLSLGSSGHEDGVCRTESGVRELESWIGGTGAGVLGTDAVSSGLS
jgi:hypothetical protein